MNPLTRLWIDAIAYGAASFLAGFTAFPICGAVVSYWRDWRRRSKLLAICPNCGTRRPIENFDLVREQIAYEKRTSGRLHEPARPEGSPPPPVLLRQTVPATTELAADYPSLQEALAAAAAAHQGEA